ncbi:ABC transporter ATP-binding protein [Leucobacter sp. M11]|uniref:ABC transporter ATP-binding protein n=1 Tax=Leucobacter sp. M11 TaxID=2993565 RepID=UPI002D7F2DC8|nr:ABC transporter ATP-binding protein [Leucobacter sp. M11]MEB4614923.1 ABC transporter ATP-binding protein [Leucobacter sp. M11]
MLTLFVSCAVLQGVAFVMLVPFLSAVFAGDADDTARWLAWIAGVAAGYVVLATIASRMAQDTASEVLRSLLARFGNRLVHLPIGWFVAADRTGKAADTATSGLVFVAATTYQIVRPIITAFVTPATVLVGATLIDWRIALVLVVAAPLVWATNRVISARMKQADREHGAAVADASARIVEFARNQPALRAATNTAVARGMLNQAIDRQHDTDQRSHMSAGGATAVFAGVVHLCVVAALIAGTSLTLSGELSTATLIGMLVLTVRFTEPIINSGALGGGIGAALNTLEYLDELDAEPVLDEPEAPRRPDHHRVRFDRVTFSYGEESVLTELSFIAPAGAMTAIVGPSGSGKSTIVRLLARFYDPQSGTVSIGGIPLPELGSTRVSDLIAPVFQDVYLFEGTILENIRLGSPEATDADVRNAAHQARVDRIVERLPEGWETRVGEGGTLLSGGERQRVSIARALLKDAPIVVLDEATAALDPENEEAIGRSMTALRDRTLIVVAHRMQTIQTAQHIIMLDGRGGIAEQGTHAELLARGGTYTRYWRSRERASGWRLTTSAPLRLPTSQGTPHDKH